MALEPPTAHSAFLVAALCRLARLVVDTRNVVLPGAAAHLVEA